MLIRRKTNSPTTYLKLAAVLLLCLGAVGFFLFIASGGGISAQGGFLGTRAPLISDLNLVAQFVLMGGLSLGVLLARRGHYKAHQYMQTSMVLSNLVLVLWVMIGSFMSNVAPGLPHNLKTLFGFISAVHGGIGLLAISCSTYLLLRMNKLLPKGLRNKNWKSLMRITFGLYWFTGILGLGLYYVWYVI